LKTLVAVSHFGVHSIICRFHSGC